MYINFKSKYKKVLWLIIGFLLACIFVQKVNALDYDLNTGFMVNNRLINNEFIDSIWEQVEGKTGQELGLSFNPSYVYHREDFPYMYIQPTQYSEPMIYFANSIEFDHYSDPNNNHNYNYNIAILNALVLRVEVFNGTFEYANDKAIQINNSGGYYPKKAITSFDFYINDNLILPQSFYYSSTTNPDYLNGYKKITLTTEDKYYMLSGLTSGSVFIPIEDFNSSGGRLSYYDSDLSSQPYTSYIQDYTTTPDGLYVRQDFNLNNYSGADWVMFSKYIYLEGEDNITYDIWVPDNIHDSQVTITPNSSGGNTFDFNYQDSDGVIQSSQVNSVDLSQDNPLLGSVFSDFSSNTFGLTSIITAPLSLIGSLSSTSCTHLNLPLPFIGGTLTLPCMYDFYSSTFGVLFTLYQTITTGIISYWVIVKIFNLVKDFKNPDHDEIEVIDL